MRNESKNNDFVSNFIFFSLKTKRKHMRVRDRTICEKLKKQ